MYKIIGGQYKYRYTPIIIMLVFINKSEEWINFLMVQTRNDSYCIISLECQESCDVSLCVINNILNLKYEFMFILLKFRIQNC